MNMKSHLNYFTITVNCKIQLLGIHYTTPYITQLYIQSTYPIHLSDQEI